MRIVQVIGSVAPRFGGPSKAILEMSGALGTRGHDVEVVTTTLAYRGSWFPFVESRSITSRIGERIKERGYHITHCRAMWPTRWATSFDLVRLLGQLIPRADVVHIHSLYLFSTLAAARTARAYGVPYVIRPHGSLDPYIRKRHRLLKALYHAFIEDRTLEQAAAIHFTTDDERRLAEPALPRGAKSRVVPLGVDLGQYRNLPERSAARAALGLPENALVCLFHGRLNHKKGLDILAPAFIKLSKEVHELWLVLAGPDDDGLGRVFAEQCESAGVASRLVRPGLLDQARVKIALAAADFWVLPSYSENFGIAVVEAMAAGLPVVISDRINIATLIDTAQAGVITTPTIEGFLAGMAALVSQSPEGRVSMGGRGRALCAQEFTWDKVAQELERLYEHIGTGSRGVRSHA
jgi:glycosyltransferase involved in cell wall biosynthesis